MTKRITPFLSGVLFAAGLVAAEMTKPSKVIGFLDVFGQWDPSLGLVMFAAVAVHAFAYRFINRLEGPIYAPSFLSPLNRKITTQLVLGSALFGVGWGLVGYCPGPAVTSLAATEPNTLVFVGFMLLSMWGHALVTRWLQDAKSGSGTPELPSVQRPLARGDV